MNIFPLIAAFLFKMLQSTPEQRKELKNAIVALPLAKQACYADPICVSLVKDREFLDKHVGNIDPNDTDQFYQWNATSVGNLAHIIVWCPYPDIVEKAKVLMESYKQFVVTTRSN